MYRVELTLTVFVDGAPGRASALVAAKKYADMIEHISDEMGAICEPWPYPPRGVVIQASKKQGEEVSR